MYCKYCGQAAGENSLFCTHCGANLNADQNQSFSEDSPSFGFAILGFFIPLVGLILFLIYEGKKPKRAKSAGKGALIGFITNIVLSIILFVLYSVVAASLFHTILGDINSNKSSIPFFGDVFKEQTTDEILEKYVDVSFGEFKVTTNGFYAETSLEVTVENKATTQCTYYITIEAVDENGTRLETDMLYADRLNPGQKINLTAFEYVEQDKINQFKNATFKVLELKKYNF